MQTVVQLEGLLKEKTEKVKDSGISKLKIVNGCINNYLTSIENPDDELLLSLFNLKMPYIELAKKDIDEHIKILAADEKLDIISELNKYYLELQDQGIDLKKEKQNYEELLERINSKEKEEPKESGISLKKLRVFLPKIKK